MYNKVLLVFNEKAGKENTGNNVGIAAGILSSNVKELTILKGGYPGELEEICRDRGEEFELVVIMGGDGTVHECVNGLALLSAPPKIAIIPTGTCNDFARTLNISMVISEACVDAVHGPDKKIDIGKVNDRFFTNFAGIGLIADTSENIEDNIKEKFGTLSYFISALKTMKETSLFSFKVRTDKGMYDGEAVMIIIMNGRFIGTRELPYEHIQPQDNKLNLLIVKEAGLPLFKEWVQSKTLLTPEAQDTDIFQQKIESASIETPEIKKIDTDGEIYLETPMEVSVLSELLTFKTGTKG
ncbi:lipid kinase [Salipaludibacillus neizhouensis]|uniref:Lipid kinase n=1 Tax=Salipaludibacillus neizhouensis TaxID=885475 RepID=A0A3A9KN68_9BACI|nr:diacylglycerol kinase family protein [Salipaludibacillus neizhouensis]RKL66176.1 lipid kinase [Salipaludibacillus neizhouensis]